MHPTQNQAPSAAVDLSPDPDAVTRARAQITTHPDAPDAFVVHALAQILDNLATEVTTVYGAEQISRAHAYLTARDELRRDHLAGFAYAREPEPDPFTTTPTALPTGVAGFALGRYAR
ncbi:hypothetical protein [Hamadaea tsunoensis]|uniref:hypothetical protein n=1 Tax=Hamadaea tsunoensis TaxID=53368 RepID=UPI000489214D|nr:hypothetical protein [Hamadaea tsunoensis]